jgi:hypothetical protein
MSHPQVSNPHVDVASVREPPNPQVEAGTRESAPPLAKRSVKGLLRGEHDPEADARSGDDSGDGIDGRDLGEQQAAQTAMTSVSGRQRRGNTQPLRQR